MSAVAIWHDVECGAYSADLPLWEELSREAEGTVLDVGCGTGRVAIHLARRDIPVVGLDVDPDLVAALTERAEGLSVRAVLGDARSFALDTDVALALAPMQLIQLLPDSEDRLECLRRIAAHLLPGGRIVLAIVERLPEPDGDAAPLPDVREIEGWVYSSLPVDTAEGDGEIAIRRLRQTVSPTGALSEERNEIRIRTLSAEQLEREGEAVGLVALGRHAIPPTDLHVGSTVVVLGRAD
jgi:SAM-dependent methyltransferase